MPANSLSEIPLIDIGPYFGGSRADKKRVADEMSRACEHIGFFLVAGHQVDRVPDRGRATRIAGFLRPAAGGEARYQAA